MNRKEVTSIRASTLRVQSLKSNSPMELGLAVIFGLHSVCSICLTLLNKQLAVEIPFPLTIARGPWQNVDLDFLILFVAEVAFESYRSLQGVTGWSNRPGPISMPREHPLHSEPQLCLQNLPAV